MIRGKGEVRWALPPDYFTDLTGIFSKTVQELV